MSKSKRQELRDKRKRQEQMQKLMIVLGVVIIVLALGALIVLPQLQPVSDVVYITPEAGLPNPNGMQLGDPNAKVVIDVWEDFQCPSCARYTEGIEPQLIAEDIPSNPGVGGAAFNASTNGTLIYRTGPGFDTNDRRLQWFDRHGKNLWSWSASRGST